MTLPHWPDHAPRGEARQAVPRGTWDYPQDMIYSGLDWSGSPGNTHGPWLIFAIVHIADDDLSTLDAEFAAAKHHLRVAPTFVFKHDDAADPVKERVFAALQHTPLQAHVHRLDKAAWRAAYPRKVKGNDCLCDGIIKLVMACPDHVVARQVLLIDPPSTKLVRELRTSIGKSFRGAHRTGFRDVRPRRDDEPDGGIIQAADMIAGEVRRQGGFGGPTFRRLLQKSTLSEATKTPSLDELSARPDPTREQGRLRDG